jgi:hypothetical protein
MSPGASGDYTMASGSYSGSNNGSFNPASFTRQFIGSPISWRAGSLNFGGRFVTSGSPMDQFFGSLEWVVVWIAHIGAYMRSISGPYFRFVLTQTVCSANEFKIQPATNDPEQSINAAFHIFDREGELVSLAWNFFDLL